jgi:thiamine phosphate synthase YjbQ (UPF0047 family)
MIYREQLAFETRTRGTYEITRRIQEVVARSQIAQGLCNVFVHHISLSTR